MIGLFTKGDIGEENNSHILVILEAHNSRQSRTQFTHQHKKSTYDSVHTSLKQVANPSATLALAKQRVRNTFHSSNSKM